MLKADDEEDDDSDDHIRVAIRPPKIRSGSFKRSAPVKALRCCGRCVSSGLESVVCCLPRMFAAFAGPCICLLALFIIAAVVLSGVSLYQVQHGATTLTTTAVDAASHWLSSWLGGGGGGDDPGGNVLLRFSTVPPPGDAWAPPPIPSMMGWVSATGVLEATVRGYPLDQVGDLVLLARNESLSGAAARRYVPLPLDVRIETSARVVVLHAAAVLSHVRATETPFLVLYRAGTTAKDYDAPVNVLLQCRW